MTLRRADEEAADEDAIVKMMAQGAVDFGQKSSVPAQSNELDMSARQRLTLLRDDVGKGGVDAVCMGVTIGALA